MIDYQHIYEHRADQYELLVAREDYQQHIIAALRGIRPIEGQDIVEFGAGTGRLTRMLAPFARHILAFDASPQMLDVAAAKLQQQGAINCVLAIGDNRNLPVADASADLALAGWTFGHSVGWYPETWRDEIGRAVGEMRRILRPGGTAIILETLGTGHETPEPPTAGLAAYYRWLEEEQGFSTTWIRTDYRFQSRVEARHLTHFFFGEPMDGELTDDKRVILPECTGVWWWMAS
jgi:ubiquinone/menaquinone biosynthesis C-methylase UbiE